jgi:signal transduction histidine kinase
MKRRHRLSARLVLLFIGISILIIFIVNSGFRYGMRDQFRAFAEPHLVEYVDHLRYQIGSPPDTQAASALAQRLQLDIQINYPDHRWSSSGQFVEDLNLRFHAHRLSNGRIVEISHDEHRFLFRLREPNLTLLFITSSSFDNGQLPLIASVTIIAVLMLIALTYHLVRRLFKPIETIRQGVARFGSGDLTHRITVHRRDELGELAKSINTMAEEIQGMLEAKRQLLLAISHELRSPLTRARLNAELLDDSQPRERIIADLQILEQQLAELLETEQLESRHAKLDLQPTVPTQLIASVMQQHFAAAHWLPHYQEDEQTIYLDSIRIKLLIRNLLDNALRHTLKEAQPVDIYSELSPQGWHFRVEDHGEGIPAEHLSHLTEPFYRVDKARQRKTGGYGLGLYLCRIIVEAHGGKLTLASEPGIGTKVSVFIPTSSPSDRENKIPRGSARQ